MRSFQNADLLRIKLKTANFRSEMISHLFGEEKGLLSGHFLVSAYKFQRLAIFLMSKERIVYSSIVC